MKSVVRLRIHIHKNHQCSLWLYIQRDRVFCWPYNLLLEGPEGEGEAKTVKIKESSPFEIIFLHQRKV